MCSSVASFFYSPLGALCESGALLKNFFHGDLEFLELDEAVLVLVDFSHDLVPYLLTALGNMASSKDKPELLLGHSAIVICIKHAEGALKILSGEEQVLLEGSCNKLGVVNASISICVCRVEHLADIRLIKVENLGDILHASLELLERQESIIVGVELEEHLTHVGQLFSLRLQVGND